jgi:parallel beta-helix repeat protein
MGHVSRTILAIILVFLTGMSIAGFRVLDLEASDTIYIRADGSIDPPMAPIQRNGDLYTLTSNIITEIHGIVIERDNMTLDGADHTVQGTKVAETQGISLFGRNNVTIKNLEIKEFFIGVNDYCSSNSTITGNSITENKWVGIWFQDSFNSNIFENNVTNNYYGIHLSCSSNNILRRNKMSNNRYNFGVTGHNPAQFMNNIDSSNTVNGKPIYYWIGSRNLTVPFDAGYIALVNCTQMTVRNLNLSSNREGILLAYTTNTSITGNNITANDWYGLKLYSSSSNSIFRNNITSNRYDGVYFDGSSKNIMSRNVIENNSIGIQFHESSYNVLSGCKVANNHNAVYLDRSYNNSISGNNIVSNVIGILIYGSSKNSISENNITTNSRYGLLLYDFNIHFGGSSNNRICHNSFINNTREVYVWYISGFTNSWDDGYPSGGNYWSDYNGTDLYSGSYQNETGNDGIGDTPYIIDGNNTDNYPLMGMFYSYNVSFLKQGLMVNIISNSTVSNFIRGISIQPPINDSISFNVASIRFNVTGNMGVGLCRICIPTDLMNGNYTVFVNNTKVPHTLLPCSNSTYNYVYFTYNHSTQEVIITPEFPPTILLPLFMVLSTLAVVFTKKRLKKN